MENCDALPNSGAHLFYKKFAGIKKDTREQRLNICT